MSLVQMSLNGALWICLIILLRTLAIHILPKVVFWSLWEITALRLLLPFSLPSPFSVRIGTEQLSSAVEQKLSDIPLELQILSGTSDTRLSLLTAIWLAGMGMMAAYFLLSYRKSIRRFRMSVPFGAPFVQNWLETHRTVRPIQVRVSDRIGSPVTYGLFRPVILLPKQMESENDRLLTSVLTHEYIHIRRFDTAAKILLAAVLCVYWFHPMVWVMVMLANRDMELACDEGVLRTLGEKQRAGYALSLLDMEERKIRGFTLCSHFSRYAIEERTLSIMRYQKCSIPASIAAVMLVSGFALILAAFPVVPGSQTDSLRTDSPSGYLLDEMDDWLAELQTTADRLVAGNQLTQQQEDRLLTYYQAQIAHLQSSAANGGEITVDLPAQNTGPVHCPLDQLTYLLPDTDDVLECCRDGTELPAVTAILPQDDCPFMAAQSFRLY